MLENSENLNSQAIELATQGFYTEALACLKRAVIIDRKNYLLWYNLGITYRDSGNLSDAKKALLKAYSLNERDDELLDSLSLVSFSMNDYQDAFFYAYRGIENNPMNPKNWNNIGVFHFSNREYEDAAEAFETALSLFPYYYDALYNLRDTYAELGNKKAARECTELLKSFKPRGNTR